MRTLPIGPAISHAIGGGWGSDEAREGDVKVGVIRGADFPQVLMNSVEGVPLRYEAGGKTTSRELRVGDIVLEISGGTKDRPTGRSVYITPDLLAASELPLIPASFCRLVRIDAQVAEPRFIYYALQHLFNQGGTWEYQNQSTGLSNFQFELFRSQYRYPGLGICAQRAIADVLGALDDKIAANAKLAGTIDELLASRFTQLVRGRPMTELRQIADVNLRTQKPKDGGQLRYLDIAAVGQGSYELPVVSGWEEAPGRARRQLAKGDTVWSTVRPNRRSHALILDEDPLLIGSTGLAVLSPNSGLFAFLYESTRTESFVAYLESAAEGSAYPAVRADRFLEAPVPDVDESAREEFEEFAAPLREHAHRANVESRSLAATRDALLPLLMSGKLRVKDAERVVEEAI